MEYKIISAGNDRKAITIKDGKTYYLIGFANKVQRWSQGGFGAGASRRLQEWDVYLYANTFGLRTSDPYMFGVGEYEYLEHRYLIEDAEKIMAKYKDELLTANSVGGIKNYVSRM